MKRMCIFMIVFGILASSGYCEISSNVDISLECISAYESFTFGTPRYFDEPVTQVYYGLSGSDPILLTLRFHKEIVEGEYYFARNKKLTVKVKGRVDTKGHLFLQEILDKGYINYEFQGKLTDQEIIGCWEKGGGKKGFDFFATTEKDSPWLKPVEFADKQSRLNATDRHGNTFLHIMAHYHYTYEYAYKSTGTVETLLSHGANVNARNQEGRTPLHNAVNWKRSTIREEDVPVITEIVELLLTNGADINALDDNGMTPLDIAQENDLYEVVELLRTYKAKE